MNRRLVQTFVNASQQVTKKLGLFYEYIEVPGGGHSDVAAPNLPTIIEIFDKHPRQPK